MGQENERGFLYAELANQLEHQIVSGVLRPGDKLPSIRKLRANRGLSISTVSQALVELERRGRVEARPRSGYFVKVAKSTVSKPVLMRHRMRPRRVPLPHLADDFVTASANPSSVPLGGAVLSDALLPLKHLGRIARSVVTDPVSSFARYGAPAGELDLRRQIARRMLDLGIAATVDEIVVSAGCMDAIRLALLATTKPGDVVMMESPTFFGFLQLVRDLGLYALEVPTHPEHGIDLRAFARAAERHRAKVAIVTPTFQNPTGACMSSADRERLGAIARRRKMTIIEDDVYGDLAHDGTRHPPLAAVADCDTIYCSSFSKTLAPGLRLGWVYATKHIERLKRLKLSGAITSPPMNQLIAAQFLESGSYERHLRRLRIALSGQVASMRRALADHLPAGSQITMPTGGFLLWVQLPADINAHVLYEKLAGKGVSILPGTLCAVDGKYQSFVRVNAGYPWTPRLKKAVSVIGRSCARLTR